ncbi:STAS domain-containing protein [Sphaerisporangium perillae]|uniref:STAS domain-containing protein n=1 Tax=Sphaerisporangium perillae TaxID=2935860 RepID=UPI00200EAB00|nr:STAS domain-containing protein [Sphaerisporangium perillae]
MAYPARDTGLDIRERHDGPCVVVEISGELDMSAVPRLRAELDHAIGVSRPPRLVLDLTRTRFCDSMGLGLLVGTYNRVRELDGRLALAVAPGAISRLLVITNLDQHFEIFPNTEDAVALLQRA